jgi:PAS domain S-box-containing protein
MSHRDPTSIGITVRYVLVLCMLALLAVVNYLILEEKIRTNHSGAIVLNFAGRQRYLLQRTASLAEGLVETTDERRQEALKRDLLAALKLMESSHEGLVSGSAGLGLPGARTEEAQRIYFRGPESLDRSMRSYIDQARALADDAAESLTPDNRHLQSIQQAATEAGLLGALDTAVEHHQQESEAQLVELRWLQRLALGGMLIVILLTAVVVFRPMQQRIEEEMGKLTALNQTLEEQVAQRSAAAEERAAQLARSQAALEEQTRVLRSILDGMTDGVAVADTKGKFLLFNAAAERILGIGATDTPPERWAEHYSLYLPDRVTPYPVDQLPLIRAMRGESVDQCELFVRPGSGLMGVWLSVSARPLLSEQGELFGGVAVFKDSTNRKQAEAALRESEALYQSLIEALPLNIFRKDLDGAFTFANQRFCDTVGRPLDDLLGKTDFDFFPVELAEKYLRDDHRVIDTCQPFEDIEQHRKPNGELLYVQVLKAPVYDSQRNIIGTQGIFWDVTDRQLAQLRLSQTAAELQRSNEELQQFALVVSQDLQQPLRKVQAFGDQLASHSRDALDDRGREHLARMQEAVARMQQLINDLLSVARITTQGEAFSLVDLNPIAAAAVADLRAQIDHLGGAIEVEPLPSIEADPLQMRQLLQNLLANALKFHRADVPPKVRVSCECVATLSEHGDQQSDMQYRLLVEDNGIGFEPRYLDRIFTVFQRLHPRGEYEGTGVGLAICRKIVERHGGSITARSTPGEGSTFIVTLSARASQEVPPAHRLPPNIPDPNVV